MHDASHTLKKKRRAFWLKQMHTWHWLSSAICLIGMLLFAFTGFTLNHAAQIEARPAVTTHEGKVPAPLLEQLRQMPAETKAPLPAVIRRWLSDSMGVNVEGRETEWSARDVYVSLPRPGGDAWLSIDRGDGTVTHEITSRGWIAYINDLHKGRHTGAAWSWFIDIFAFACVVFCLTGFVLLQLHARNRPATWPVVGLGLVIPALLAILFIHS